MNEANLDNDIVYILLMHTSLIAARGTRDFETWLMHLEFLVGNLENLAHGESTNENTDDS
jgi:hypothetical protein